MIGEENAACKTRPALDEGLFAQEPPLLLTSLTFIFHIIITCFLDS